MAAAPIAPAKQQAPGPAPWKMSNEDLLTYLEIFAEESTDACVCQGRHSHATFVHSDGRRTFYCRRYCKKIQCACVGEYQCLVQMEARTRKLLSYAERVDYGEGHQKAAQEWAQTVAWA